MILKMITTLQQSVRLSIYCLNSALSTAFFCDLTSIMFQATCHLQISLPSWFLFSPPFCSQSIFLSVCIWNQICLIIRWFCAASLFSSIDVSYLISWNSYGSIIDLTIWLYIYLSIYLPIFLFACLSIFLSIHLSIHLSTCIPSLTLHPLICSFTYLHLSLPLCLSLCFSLSQSPSVFLTVSLGLSVSVRPSVRLSASLSLAVSVSLSLSLSVPVSVSLSLSLCPSLSVELCLTLALALALAWASRKEKKKKKRCLSLLWFFFFFFPFNLQPISLLPHSYWVFRSTAIILRSSRFFYVF